VLRLKNLGFILNNQRVVLQLLLGLFLCQFSGPIAYGISKTTLDPTDVAIGATALSLGQSYVTRTNDGHGIFLNPGTLGSMRKNSLTFTGSQYIGEVFRFYGGGTMPLDQDSSWGAGLIYSDAGGGNIRDINNQTLGAAISFLDATALIGYGRRMPVPFSNSRLKNLMFGANLKVFNKNFSGVSGGASGLNADVGFIYKFSSMINLGVHLKNVMGNQLLGTNSSSVTEALERHINLGASFSLFGPSRLFPNITDQKLLISTDLSTLNGENLLHMGAEWQPMKQVALRGGLYQSIDATGTNTFATNWHLSMGVGYTVGNYHFNYAYHPNEFLDNSASHIFTMTIFESSPSMYKMQLLEPKDKTITYAATANVVGFLVYNNGYVRVNGNEIQMDSVSSNRFDAAIPLKLGRNKLFVEYFNDDDELVSTASFRILRLKQFADIPRDYYVRKTIEEVGTLGLITTPNENIFQPSHELLRKEMMAYLLELYKQADEFERYLSQVEKASNESDFRKFLKETSSEELIVGYPDGYLKPEQTITRIEGASLFVRFDELYGGGVTVNKVISFKDITADHWAAVTMAKARKSGIIHGTDLTNFKPDNIMKKVEMTLMMARTKFVKDKIRHLYDWDSY